MAGAKGLATLIRLAKWNVDEKRRVLTALQAREEQILAEIHAAEVQLAEEQRLAASDATGIGAFYGAYAQAWLDRRAQQFGSLAAVRDEIQRARDDLAEAFTELKTYEITDRERRKRAQQERDRKEQAFLDEVGLTMHRRRPSEDPEG